MWILSWLSFPGSQIKYRGDRDSVLPAYSTFIQGCQQLTAGEKSSYAIYLPTPTTLLVFWAWGMTSLSISPMEEAQELGQIYDFPEE